MLNIDTSSLPPLTLSLPWAQFIFGTQNNNNGQGLTVTILKYDAQERDLERVLALAVGIEDAEVVVEAWFYRFILCLSSEVSSTC